LGLIPLLVGYSRESFGAFFLIGGPYLHLEIQNYFSFLIASTSRDAHNSSYTGCLKAAVRVLVLKDFCCIKPIFNKSSCPLASIMEYFMQGLAGLIHYL